MVISRHNKGGLNSSQKYLEYSERYIHGGLSVRQYPSLECASKRITNLLRVHFWTSQMSKSPDLHLTEHLNLSLNFGFRFP